jgi:ribulose 1,5-bisphosphate carboxylase large subunit-like protein
MIAIIRTTRHAGLGPAVHSAGERAFRSAMDAAVTGHDVAKMELLR